MPTPEAPTIEGRRFRLRPIGPDDAELVLSLRLDPELGRYLNPTSPDVSDQQAWIAQRAADPCDFVFIVEDRVGHVPEGSISIYHVDPRSGEAEMGRWILRHGSMAAPESALLAYRFAFGELGLQRVYCRTLASNDQVVSFHSNAGLVESGTPLEVTIATTRHRVVEQAVDAMLWPVVEANLERGAAAVERLLDPERRR